MSELVPEFVRNSVNLASAGLGAEALFVTDDFFANVSRMLADGPPEFDPDLYDNNGKYMDGWESKRRRNGGHDFTIVKLAVAGELYGFDVDTAFFTGNYPPACKIEGLYSPNAEPDEDSIWQDITGVVGLSGNSHHYIEAKTAAIFTHIRLHIYPDGGVARLRVYGKPKISAENLTSKEIDLASALNGARVIAYSDAHYGSFQRLLSPGRGINMGDGWETRRRRVPGNDWLIIALGVRGIVSKIEIDTAHYKGNYPDGISIQGADLGADFDSFPQAAVTSAMFWDELMGMQSLNADQIHMFGHVNAMGPITHVRVNIYPDGGLSRIRLYGEAHEDN